MTWLPERIMNQQINGLPVNMNNRPTDTLRDMLRIYRKRGYDLTLISLRKRYDNGEISLIQMGKIVNSLTSIEMMTSKERKLLFKSA